ncbi:MULTISPECIES: NAD(P)-dependent oxidoreductase [unclassified Pseudofrankia]|uniref:NAD-dependent epimerase/dehydratase family protein n=1 Tax=unclassified Pseudofrankia TaxID=2994372 RepID=UPI000A741A47|nr:MULTISPECIES: NAD(P)-dependent oxidoreductase [unclassified Pseudofrankia]MDT3442236.1 NAD(P)-dependent oxidoreductase [Pseudofrankia sp. BMG5.37]
MLSGEKILVTGVTGSVAGPLARFLANENEVWGLARFRDSERREHLEQAGIMTCAGDVSSGGFEGVPDDFTYVLHLAWARGDFSRLHDVLRVNVEGTGLLLQHCRKAKAALVMSSTAVYSTNSDPWHAFTEDDPVGNGAAGHTASTSPASKLGQESVARFCALAFELPVVIARLNTFTGIPRSLPGLYVASVLGDRPVVLPGDPFPHSPIDVEDMKAQLEPLLDAASTPALTVNWCGDDVITAREWIALAAEWAGTDPRVTVEETQGGVTGNVSDAARRQAITGPCTRSAADSYRTLYESMMRSAH